MRKLVFSKPPESDRLIGFTIPNAGTFYICDHDDVWCATLGASPTILLTDHRPYSFVKGRSDFLGIVFQGQTRNHPLLRVGQNEISFDFNPKRDFATIRYSIAGLEGQIAFRTLSGDWFTASLSDDGQYLILADPYDLAIYAVT